MKKRGILILVAAILLLALIPAVLVGAGFATPAQFGESYYGELSVLYKNLKNTGQKKIVLIGNSAFAFGARTDLLEAEFEDYKVVLFGLYGAVGTKTMLDLSKNYVKEGDIVIIAPELYAQSCSLYFSASDTWRAADGDFGILSDLPANTIGKMLCAFPGYVAEKYAYLTGARTADANAPYARSAFEDETGKNAGYMTFDRPNNIMAGGYDAANLPVLGSEVFGDGFIGYLNEYAAQIKKTGATVYFGFTPLNDLSLGENAQEKTDALYDFLRGELDFEVLGHPAKYQMDYRLFYDSNFHVNSAGAVYYTDALAEDLKLVLGIPGKNAIELPAIPKLPTQEIAEGDNSDADCFLYEVRTGATGDYVILTGLTEEGKTRTSLTLPSSYNGIPVRQFSKDLFAGNQTISRIVLPKSITTIYDGSFSGAVRLRELVFRHDEVLSLSVGVDFLAGADDCYIYIKSNVSTADCAGGWARYANRLRRY